MSFYPSSYQQSASRPTLREVAAARAASARGGAGGGSLVGGGVAAAGSVAASSSSSTAVAHPLSPVAPTIGHPVPSNPPPPVGASMAATTSATAVEEARRRWRQHGSDASQALEDRRSRLLASSRYPGPIPTSPVGVAAAAAAASYPSGSASALAAAHGGGVVVPPTAGDFDGGGGGDVAAALGGGSGSVGPCYSVRVLSAEDRTDISGAPYTSYVLSVETSRPASRAVIEHRYSEFARLHRELDANGVTMGAKFPSKLSIFGRMGNWTPGATLAPEKSRDLVEYRKTKLDVWLVELCELLNRGGIRGEVREQCDEFLRVSGAARPPCDRANHVSWDGLERGRGGGAGGAGPLQRRGANGNGAAAVAGSKHAGGAEKYISNPLSFTLGSSIRQAAYTVMHMCGSRSTWSLSDQSIPLDLLHQAKGLCFLTVVKAGLVLSGRVGTGLIVSRSADGGWSPPSAVGTVGVGWGALVGGDITTYLIVLNTDSAVSAFAGEKGTVNLGAELGVAVGPVGRGATGNLSGGDGGVAPAYSYAHSKGLFVGISLEGSVVTTRTDVNAKFYGRDVDARTLLFGNVQHRPRAAQPPYDALDEAMGAELPEGGFRPARCSKRARRDAASTDRYSHLLPSRRHPQRSDTEPWPHPCRRCRGSNFITLKYHRSRLRMLRSSTDLLVHRVENCRPCQIWVQCGS